MRIQIADDIVTAAQFKSRQSALLRQLRETRRPIVITQHGAPAAVVLTPEEYDRLAYERAFIDAVSTGLEDAKTGRLVTHEEANRQFSEVIGRHGPA